MNEEGKKMSDRRGEKGEEAAGHALPSHLQTSQHPRARKGATGHPTASPRVMRV